MLIGAASLRNLTRLKLVAAGLRCRPEIFQPRNLLSLTQTSLVTCHMNSSAVVKVVFCSARRSFPPFSQERDPLTTETILQFLPRN